MFTVAAFLQIVCTDYFGQDPKVYNTTGEPTSLAIVNGVAYYTQKDPDG